MTARYCTCCGQKAVDILAALVAIPFDEKGWRYWHGHSQWKHDPYNNYFRCKASSEYCESCGQPTQTHEFVIEEMAEIGSGKIYESFISRSRCANCGHVTSGSI